MTLINMCLCGPIQYPFKPYKYKVFNFISFISFSKVNLLHNVMETIVNGEGNKISEETKVQLSDIKNSFRRKERPQVDIGGGRLSIVNEGETTNSLVSDISYSMSEDLSEDNMLGK